MDKRALLIVGSSRKKKNTYIFAKTFRKAFEERGVKTTMIYSIDNYDKIKTETIQKVNISDIVGFLSPLYADYMPAHMLKFLEMLSEKNSVILKNKILFGMSQCAFPYWKLNANSVKSMEFYAKENSMNFAGGLSYGGAGLMDGESFEEMGSRGKKLIKGINIAVEGILNDSKIPEISQKLFELIIPKIFTYPMLWYVNANTKKLEKKIGKNIETQAYWD
jgi:multimeric flavodoxin WrbA